MNHILEIWNIASRTHRVFPPCEVSHLRKLKHIDSDEIIILSVGQFRPEKDHPLQVHAMHELRKLLANNEPLWNRVNNYLSARLNMVLLYVGAIEITCGYFAF